jgi:hypothetical protein
MFASPVLITENENTNTSSDQIGLYLSNQAGY